MTYAGGAEIRAHPRAGGENKRSCRAVDIDIGSSPRWRGKHNRIPQHPAHVRLIPALAGKTLG